MDKRGRAAFVRWREMDVIDCDACVFMRVSVVSANDFGSCDQLGVGEKEDEGNESMLENSCIHTL